jgi:hypothetical protein
MHHPVATFDRDNCPAAWPLWSLYLASPYESHFAVTPRISTWPTEFHLTKMEEPTSAYNPTTDPGPIARSLGPSAIAIY